MDGRFTKTQVSSRPETILPEVWSSLSKSAQKNAKQQWDIEQPKIQAARQSTEIHDVPPYEVREFDATILECQKEAGVSSETSTAMRYTSTHPHRQDTNAGKLQRQENAGRDPLALSSACAPSGAIYASAPLSHAVEGPF